jgi:hypothetical protein
MNNEFDFLCETILHISEVKENLETISSDLLKRGHAHDRTKLQEPEFSAFVSTREKFKKANYGSKEYQECCDVIKSVVDHHYANNRHHTGFYKDGVTDMTLMDIMEMIADWKAAERRSPDSTLNDTLELTFKKHAIEGQLQKIITNTLGYLRWL